MAAFIDSALGAFKGVMRNIYDGILRSIIVLALTFGLNVGLIYVFKIAWSLYLETPAGAKFQKSFALAKTLSLLYRKLTFEIAAEMTVAAFVFCLAVAAVCQLLGIARYLYESRGFFGKIIVWGLPLGLITAWYIDSQHRWANMEIAYAISIISTLCLFMTCFRVASDVLPTLADMKKGAGEAKESLIPSIRNKTREIIDKINSTG